MMRKKIFISSKIEMPNYNDLHQLRNKFIPDNKFNKTIKVEEANEFIKLYPAPVFLEDNLIGIDLIGNDLTDSKILKNRR